jgi:YtkA-like
LRLRAIPLLVVIVACVAAIGVWTDRPHVTLQQDPPVVHQSQPWNAVVEISRRGRRLDGFRPVFEVTDPEGNSVKVPAKSVGGGEYKVSVVFPKSGFYSYKLVVADRIAARGTVYAVPR